MGSSQPWAAALAPIAGVFLGSALGWLGLGWGVTLFSQRLTPTRLKWLNRLAGAAIFAFGLGAIAFVLQAGAVPTTSG